MLNYHLPKVFGFLAALSLLFAGRSEAQTISSPELFGVYQSFPPINGSITSRNATAVTIAIERTGQSWDGSKWVDTGFSTPSTRLATTLTGQQWAYHGALPQEDGVYEISVRVHSGNSGHGTGIEIRVESGHAPNTLTLFDVAGNPLPPGSFDTSAFKPLVKIAAGKVRRAAVADFNGDQKPDLVVGSGASNIALLLGDGSGGFAPAGNFAVNAPASFLVAGDFNGDAHPDVAVSHSNTDSVSIFLGDGAGRLVMASRVGVGNTPIGMVAADLNGDGHLDLATANYGTRMDSDTVSILLGSGTGHFRLDSHRGVGNGPTEITAGDFNADGKPDLAVSNSHAASVSILLNNGRGFKEAITVATGEYPGSITAADLNGDGHTDLATANGHRWDNKQHTISILTGNGRGGFQSYTQVLPGVQPQGVAATDIDGDGNSDLCIADAPMHRLVILPGNDSGGFSAPVVLPTGSNPGQLAVADFNADQKPDFAAVTFNTMSILLRH